MKFRLSVLSSNHIHQLHALVNYLFIYYLRLGADFAVVLIVPQIYEGSTYFEE